MKTTFKIICIILLIGRFSDVAGQNESPLQPFFNRVILNPAYAGFDKESSFQTGNQFSGIDSASSYNLFYTTYDTYSDKLKGGIAFLFQQGLIGSKNISTTEIGFTYAGFSKKTKNGTIRFGFNTNILLATKQLYIYTLDRLMENDFNEPNPPGEEFLRYALVKPRVSFLWDFSNYSWGVTLGSMLKMNIAEQTDDTDDQLPFTGSFYFVKNSEGYRKGLHSSPFVVNPELMVYYQEDFILGRLNLYTEFTRFSLGTFLQGEFSDNIYSAGGIGGFASDNLRINLGAGASFSTISKKVGFTGELSLILKVPQHDYSKINPWEPQ